MLHHHCRNKDATKDNSSGNWAICKGLRAHHASQLAQARVEVRTALYNKKREMVEAGKAARSGSLSARESRFSHTLGRDLREDRKEWKLQRQEKEDEYIAWARGNRKMTEATRESARKSLMRLLKRKQKAGKMERGNDHLVAEEKKRILANKRKEVNAIYSARYASSSDVAKMWGNGSQAGSTTNLHNGQSPRSSSL